jgi:hypothetical protein
VRIAFLALVACVIGTAFAQDTPSSHRFTPEWSQVPTSYDCWGNYPRSARGNSVTAIVHMCCTPRPDRRLDCRIAFEQPENRRFGERTLRIARRFRLSEESYAEYRADPNAWLQVPVLWEPILPAVNRDEYIAAVNERTRGLCAPPGDSMTRFEGPEATTGDPIADGQVFRCPTLLDRR